MTLEELELAVGLLAGRVTTAEAALDVAGSEIDDLDEQVSTLQLSTPTLEEQMFSTVIPSWNGGTTFTSGPRMTLLVAPFPMRIQAVGISIEYTTLAAGQPAVAGSNTNYWRLTLERGLPSGSFPDIVSKTTQLTGAEAGGAIATRKAWTFDSGNWNADRDLAKDDLLCLLWADTGTPTTVRLPMTVTVRYSAL
jgi:hypothetical protein